MMPVAFRYLFHFTCFLLAVSSAVAQDWRSIRGPQFDGSAGIADEALASGPLQLKVVWKRALGSGYSGVVTSGNLVLSAEADSQVGQEFLVAMDRPSGKTVWRTPTGKIMKGENGSFDGPLATPTVDDQRIYHLSPFGDLAAYSLTDGKQIWSRNLKDDFSVEPNFYGFGASPLVHDGVLIIAVGSPEGAVMGFDPVTGKVLWKAGEDGAAFQSPIPIQLGGQPAVAVTCNTTLFLINPKTGAVLWSRPHGGAAGMPSFAVFPVPLPGGGLFMNDRREGSTVLDINAGGSTERWLWREIRNSYSVPVMSGGLLCSYSSRFLVAVDPETGDRLWRTRKPGDGFLATVAGRLVVATLNGSLHVGDVSEAGFNEVAATEVFSTGTNSSDGKTWSMPTIAGRSVYLRSLGAIARIDIEPSDAQGKVTATQLAANESEVAPGFATFLRELDASENKQATIDSYLQGKSMPLIEGDHVHFILQGDHDDVAVASDLFGARQERGLNRVAGTDLFFFGVHLPESTRVSYVYFADYQPLVDPKNDRQVVSTTMTGEMEPSFMKPGKPLTLSWFDKGDIAANLPASVDNPPKQLAGRLDTFQFKSNELNADVKASVYLPPGYEDTTVKYPVVFVHDGTVAINSGNQAHVLDDLIRSNKVRPSIAVFIDRRFYPMQGAAGYPEMFAKELLPQISDRYRVSENRGDRACMSGGFGATLALMATLPASDQIGRIGCHSPFAFEMLHPVFVGLSKLPNQRCEILIQSSKYDFRNPSENWDMALQAEAISRFATDGGHQVTTESTQTCGDWVGWRTQSERMWTFLLDK